MILKPDLNVEQLATWLGANEHQPLWVLNGAIQQHGYSLATRQAAFIMYADRHPQADVDL